MRARLNLATVPFESNRRFALGAAVTGTLAVVALLFLSVRAYISWSNDKVTREQHVAIEKSIAAQQQQRQELAAYFNEPGTVQRRERAAYLNGLIHQRAFPWIKIFMDLEQILPEGTHVVSIEPKLQGDNVQLRVLVGAITDESKLKFLKALETSPEFSNIQLLSESRSQRPEQSDRVMLELVAQYSVI
jgi:hypothetical protein